MTQFEEIFKKEAKPAMMALSSKSNIAEPILKNKVCEIEEKLKNKQFLNVTFLITSMYESLLREEYQTCEGISEAAEEEYNALIEILQRLMKASYV